MPAPDWEDLDVFLQAADFAVEVEIVLQAGGPRTLRAIFDDPFLDAQLGEYVFETTQPRLTARLADLAGVRRGDTATIDGETFDVLTGPQPDGTGMAMLELARPGA